VFIVKTLNFKYMSRKCKLIVITVSILLYLMILQKVL